MSADERPTPAFPRDEHPLTGGEVTPESGASADPTAVIGRIRDALEDVDIEPDRAQQHGGNSWNDERTRDNIRQRFGHTERAEPYLPGFGPDGHGETAREDCGDDHPFICVECARSVCLGRTCKMSVCSRCGAAWTRDAAIQKSAKLSRIRKEKNRAMTPNCNTHHQIVSPPPEWWYDLADAGLSLDEAYEVTDEIVADVVDEMRGCGVVVRHSYRGLNDDGEMRGHDQGDMGMWKELINQERGWWGDVRDELAWQPHYHCILAADFLAGDGFTDVVQYDTGWVIHRITGEDNKSLPNDAAVARALTYSLSHGDIIVNDESNNRAADFYAGYADGRSPWNDLAPTSVDYEVADRNVRDAAETVLGLYSQTTECGMELPVVADQNELAYRILQEIWGDDAERPARDGSEQEAVLGHLVEGNISARVQTGNGGRVTGVAVDGTRSDLSRPVSTPASSSGNSTSAGAGRLLIDYSDEDELRCCRDEVSHLDPHDHADDQEPDECDGSIIPLAEARRRGLLEDDEWLNAAPFGDEARAADDEWDDDLPSWNIGPEDVIALGADNSRRAVG